MIPPRLAAGLTLLIVIGALASVGGLAADLNLVSQALTPYGTCTLTATTATSTSEIDASVRQGSANANFGTATTNNVTSQNNANRRLYLWFDLTICSPAIPSSAIIRLATLRLFATAMPASDCRTVDVFRVTSTWTEVGITWNNQPFGTTINNPAVGAAVDTYAIGTLAGCENATTTSYIDGPNVTIDVAAFIDGSATNLGWMLRDDVEGNVGGLTQTYTGKDAGNASRGPQLVITYVTVP